MSGTNLLQSHVTWDLNHDDTHEQKLISQIHRILADVDICGEAIGQSAREVHAIDLENEQAQEQKNED